jgi:putative alpha-1,2-mannosidase
MLWMLAAIEESPAYAAKGQYYLRRAVTELYKDDVEMFAGDEDNGEMASWFLLASAGLYVFCYTTFFLLFLFMMVSLSLIHILLPVCTL